MEDQVPNSLRHRKWRRTRDAIVEAAMTLFAERGFAAVTVTDIADRAEVGRSTFFRYFADKQEVLFANDPDLVDRLAAACDEAAAPLAPLGESVTSALIVARAGLLALVDGLGDRSRWLGLRERLLQEHTELHARQLVKERGYVAAGVEVMVRHGARPDTAALAASLAAACFATGQARTQATGRALTDTVAEAFGQLATLDPAVLRASTRTG